MSILILKIYAMTKRHDNNKMEMTLFPIVVATTAKFLTTTMTTITTTITTRTTTTTSFSVVVARQFAVFQTLVGGSGQ